VTVWVLGTHTSHDGSACLLRDGEIAVAIAKERLTRRKHDGGDDDDDAVRYCLDAAGIGVRDLDLVVQNDNFHGFETPRLRGRLVDEARRVVTISHHLAHAHSAVATAPFADAAVLVVDGCGSPFSRCADLAGADVPEPPPPRFAHLACEKDSFYALDGGDVVPLVKDFSEWQDPGAPAVSTSTTRHSIGGVYLAASAYAFRGLDDPGKLMGLAPYGRAGRVEGEIFDLRDGRVLVREGWAAPLDRPARSRADFEADRAHYADVAAWVQREVERALLYLVADRHARHRSPRLCYAGGVALNAVANRVLLDRGPFEDIYVQPAAGDDGVSIGCADYGWTVVLGRPRRRHGGSACFGRPYGRAEVDAAVARRSASVRRSEPRDAVEAAADALVAGKVVGWFRGGSEFGPRALGHRSILALPGTAEVRDRVNARVKRREDFRPFAPSVPADAAAEWFEQDRPTPYMTFVAPARAEARGRIPAVVHVDGTARVQTVDGTFDARFLALHRRVAERTGVPVLLNTSLNRRGMPIVETPDEAIDLFLESALDVLVLDDVVLEKTGAAGEDAPGYDATVEALRLRLGTLPARRTSSRVNLEVTGLEDALVLDLGEGRLVEGSVLHPDCTLRCSARVLRDLVLGATRLEDALATGALEVPGLATSEASALADALRAVFPGRPGLEVRPPGSSNGSARTRGR
jgi:carbamoyltransferase